MSDRPESYEDLKKQNELLKKEINDLKQKLVQKEQELSDDIIEWYKILEKYSREGIFLLENGNLVMLNKMGYDMFGYDYDDDVLGMNILDVYDDEGKKIIKKKIREKYVGFYEVNGIKKDGTKFPIEIYSINISLRGREYRLAIIRDISERVENLKKIEQHEIKFKTLFEYAGDAILVGDEKGNIIDMNNRFCQITGYDRDELINKHVKIIFSEESLNHNPLKFDLLKQVPLIITERELLCKDGSTIPIEMNTTLMDNNYHLAIIRDLTERKRNQQELLLKNRELQEAKEKAEENDKLKSEFLANMSHEIRTPMNGILGFARMLGEEGVDKEQQKFYIDIIENSSNQLMRIIDDILEISILETKQVKVVEHPINLNRLFLELFTIYEYQAKNNKTPLYLRTGMPDDKVLIYVDDVKLRKVICNLIDNALRYTNEGYIELSYEIKGDKIHIRVKDTGIGIPKEKQEKIFERFSQADKHLSREYGGLGLGLSIAKENTELMGGEILVSSEKGKGSEFTLVIPYKPVNKQDADIEIRNNKRPDATILNNTGHKLTILIAEDEEVNFFYLTTIITKLNSNINILHAKTGEEAVEICRNNDNIDLVLMDIKMPKLNGLDATRTIREFRPDLNIIVQSAYSTFEDRHNALEAGCDEFLEKPINVDRLKDLLNKILIEKQA